MGQYFKDTQEMYDVFGALFGRASRDPQIGPKLAASGLVVRFNYTDPEGSITINLKDKPPEEGVWGTFEFGESTIEPDVTMTQSADFSNRFWQGKENAIAAIATRKITSSGSVTKAIALLPAIRPLFRLYPKVLEEMGLQDMIVK